MEYIAPALIVVLGGLFGLFGIVMLKDTRKSSAMDKKDKKGNIFGSIFLLIVAALCISGGVSFWLSSKTAQNTVEITGQQSQKAAAPEASIPSTAADQPPQTQEEAQAQKNTKRQEAEKAVKSFAQAQKEFNYVLTTYQSKIKDISNGTVNPADSIDLDRISQQTLDLLRDVKNMDIANRYASERQIMVTAVLYLQGSIDSLKSYIDDKKINKFTEAQDFLQKAVEANKLVTIGVAKQALIDGYNPPQQ